MIYVKGYAKTGKGNIREINEDNLCVNRYFKKKDDDSSEYEFKEAHDCLIGVFDGIGGEDCGEVASFISAKTMARFDGHLPDDDWDMLLNEMNYRINDYAKEHQPCNLGSTAAIVSVKNGIVQACNLGDSRIYLYQDKVLKKVSKDHTELQRILDMNLKDFNLEASGIKKNRLTRYLGIRTDKLNPFVVKDIVLQPGMFFLLCSDGLTDMVSEEQIQATMALNDCKKIADSLMEQALAGGGRDNITIIVLTGEEKKSIVNDSMPEGAVFSKPSAKKKVSVGLIISLIAMGISICCLAFTAWFWISNSNDKKQDETLGTTIIEPTVTNEPKDDVTNTPEPTATSTPSPTPETNVLQSTATSTPEPTATSTPEATATETPTPEPTATVTPTPEPTKTPTPSPKVTRKPKATATSTPKVTATSTPTATPTLEPTATVTPTPTLEPTAMVTPTPTPELTQVLTPTPTPETTTMFTPEPSGTTASEDVNQSMPEGEIIPSIDDTLDDGEINESRNEPQFDN